MNTLPVLLALDAAFGPAAGCLVLSDGCTLTAETAQDIPHSQSILPMLQGLLDRADIGWRQLEMLALGHGPGSFTGLRVTAAICAGINASLSLPVLTFSSLAVTAAQAAPGTAVHVVEDARAGFVYVGCYRAMEAVQDDVCMSRPALEMMPAATYVSRTGVIIPGWRQVACATDRPAALGRLARAAASGVDAGALPRLVRPRYLQASQAERKAGLG